MIGALVGAAVGFAAAWVMGGSRVRAERAAGQAALSAATQESVIVHERTMTELERGLRERHTVELAEASEAAAQARVDEAGAVAEAKRLGEENAELREQARRDQDVLKAFEPVKVKMREIQDHVARLERERAEQYGKLDEQLRQAATTDENLRQQTQALVGALRTTSARGQWGEIELRRVLEISGLNEGVDFQEQESFKSTADPSREVRPDVTIHLPDGGYVAIDAKVPLAAFLEAIDLGSEGTAEEEGRREALLRKHARALRTHVDTLAKREYWEAMPMAPEFTVLFLPSENLMGEAFRADATLLEYSLNSKVALATPSSLLALLKTVALGWRQKHQSEDAKELLRLGESIFEQLSVLGSHVAKMGRSLTGAVADYNKVVGSLEGRILPSARRFPGFDEKKLEPIEELGEEKAQVRQLTKPELLAGIGPGEDASGERRVPFEIE